MKKSSLIIAISLVLFGVSCSNSTETKSEHQPDSVLADSTKLGPLHENDGTSTDSPALGTDNIRMDSMNNSSR